MPSFETINYSIRPNKNIERKLIFESLSSMRPFFDVSTYHYIGLGSLWFVDFILAHKILQIRKMFSIEREAYASRAAFNRPYNCVEVVPGDTTVVLPDLFSIGCPSICWLDFDSGLDGTVFSDVEILAEKAEPGSILLVTLNAHKNQLYAKKPGGEQMQPEEALRYYGNDTIPTPIPKKALTTSGFPSFLASMIIDFIKSVTRRTARGVRFTPIYNFYYKDNAPMITIGGMFTNDGQFELLEDFRLSTNAKHLFNTEQFEIAAPCLTQKEKIALDGLFPRKFSPTIEDVELLGFDLKEKQISAYHKLYRLYPMFAEYQL